MENLSKSGVGFLLTWLLYLCVVVFALDLGLSYLPCLWMYIKWQFHFAVYIMNNTANEKNENWTWDRCWERKCRFRNEKLWKWCVNKTNVMTCCKLSQFYKWHCEFDNGESARAHYLYLLFKQWTREKCEVAASLSRNTLDVVLQNIWLFMFYHVGL